MKRNLIAPENALEHDLFFGPQVAGTQISPPWQKSPRTYRTQTGIIAWMDGDLYNREQIVKQRNWTEQSDIELLVSLITRPDTKSALTALDGLFSLVLLDTHRHQLHILTDRYGLRPLFFHTGPSGISWSSEAKSFLG
ncbi:MAG: hypothetical protein O3B73_15460, partial [bacterium]|nr:hypothetical protein [bacterium]